MFLSLSHFQKEKVLLLCPICPCLESKLKISEEDLGPVVRQRSNTLPKSFGSQLEKDDDKKQDLSDKSAKPAVEVTLDSIQKKLQEKRAETNRPEDIKVKYIQFKFRPLSTSVQLTVAWAFVKTLYSFTFCHKVYKLYSWLSSLDLVSFPLCLVSVIFYFILFLTELCFYWMVLFVLFWFSQIPSNSSEFLQYFLLCISLFLSLFAFGKFWVFQSFWRLIHLFSSRSFQSWMLLSQGILLQHFGVSR